MAPIFFTWASIFPHSYKPGKLYIKHDITCSKWNVKWLKWLKRETFWRFLLIYCEIWWERRLSIHSTWFLIDMERWSNSDMLHLGCSIFTKGHNLEFTFVVFEDCLKGISNTDVWSIHSEKSSMIWFGRFTSAVLGVDPSFVYPESIFTFPMAVLQNTL